MSSSIKEITKLFINQVIQRGDLEVLDKIMHDDYQRDFDKLPEEGMSNSSAKWIINESDRKPGKLGFREFIENAITEQVQEGGEFFWDFNIKSVFEENETVIIFYTVTPTKSAKYTVRSGYKTMSDILKISIDAVHKLRFHENQIIEAEFIWDTLSYYEAQGLVDLNQDEMDKFNTYIKEIQQKGFFRGSRQK